MTLSQPVRAFIAGCSGLMLTDQEKAFFHETRPWGLILFARNLEHPDQIRSLITAFRDAVCNPDAPVLIDQEGGRVQRLRPPNWMRYPAALQFSKLADRQDGRDAERAAWLTGYLIGSDLRNLGITVNCQPVLDVPIAGSTEAIGDRAFGHTIDAVIKFAGETVHGLQAAGVHPVIKHLPGHGRALVDSHEALPRVSASHSELVNQDFAAFQPFADHLMGMTAHVVYEAIDPDRPATLSPIVIETIIRQHIGFDGLLMSDDISMGALQMPMTERCALAIDAGCDLVLHCNGHMDEMTEVASAVPVLQGSALTSADAITNLPVQHVEPGDEALREELRDLMARMEDGA